MSVPAYPDLIRRLRQHLELTQEQLARELGVTFATVNGWENGKHRPSPLAARAVLRLAQDCGIDESSPGDSHAVPRARRRR